MISKHLMLLFIALRNFVKTVPEHFKTSYVIVYLSDRFKVLMADSDFKTSYVIVYLKE